jgi:hypothetical protein
MKYEIMGSWEKKILSMQVKHLLNHKAYSNNLEQNQGHPVEG